jgi:hypothetical protein
VIFISDIRDKNAANEEFHNILDSEISEKENEAVNKFGQIFLRNYLGMKKLMNSKRMFTEAWFIEVIKKYLIADIDNISKVKDASFMNQAEVLGRVLGNLLGIIKFGIAEDKGVQICVPSVNKIIDETCEKIAKEIKKYGKRVTEKFIYKRLQEMGNKVRTRRQAHTIFNIANIFLE